VCVQNRHIIFIVCFTIAVFDTWFATTDPAILFYVSGNTKTFTNCAHYCASLRSELSMVATDIISQDTGAIYYWINAASAHSVSHGHCTIAIGIQGMQPIVRDGFNCTISAHCVCLRNMTTYRPIHITTTKPVTYLGMVRYLYQPF